MTVRRLADASVQPESFVFDAANAAAATAWIAKYPEGRQASAVIPLMMLAQEQQGWVTRAAIETIADMLDMPYIRVLEVATFYTQYQLQPVGTRAHVQVCGTTPCMLRGAGELIEVCKQKIHQEPHHLNADGTLSWEEVECQGACVNAPMVMIFKDTYEDLTPERLAEIIDQFEAGNGAHVPAGPQNGRITSAPIGGPTVLTSETEVSKPSGDEEGAAAAEAASSSPGPADDDAVAQEAEQVPPSKAGRPKTFAPETSQVLQTPSPEQSPATAERAESVPATPHDPDAADRSAEEVEGVSRPRKHSDRRRSAEASAPGEAGRPAAIDRPAEPDDLKLISGVGPKIEATLHSLGIYTFAQIAAWTDAEVQWVDGYLRFNGRIRRDEWIRQAGALAAGGVAEYVRVFGREPR